jgi:hypothetical protein
MDKGDGGSYHVSPSERLDWGWIYTSKGWFTVPVPLRAKGPILDEWPKLRLTEADLEKHFSGAGNIGLLLGTISGGLTDVDLDAPEALAAAPVFLLPTRMISGRQGKPKSHWWYITTPTPTTMVFSDPLIADRKKATMAELRGNAKKEDSALQTVVPPSIHETGEPVRWEDLTLEPARVSAEELIERVTYVSVCALIARYWPGQGEHGHDLVLALSGALLRAGLELTVVKKLVLTSAEIAGYSRAKEADVDDTARNLQEGRAVTGRTRFAELMPRKVVDEIWKWLGKPNRRLAILPWGPYTVDRGRICWTKQSADGRLKLNIPLCNFQARIVAEVTTDDGRETSRAFEIEGSLNSGRRLPLARVPVAKFAAMGWPLEVWGHHAAIVAGVNSRDRLREAMQLLSDDVAERHVYAHTGWVRIDGASVYLHAGGAVGAEGIEVSLADELDAYTLPEVAEDPRGAMETSLALLELGPLTVTVPLWASVWRAVLASALPADLSVFLEGQSGALKSSLVALFLSHYGAFERLKLPGAWMSTANQLEHRAFTLKDALFVIDDFAPQALDAKELQAKTSRILRAQGNLAGRGRLNSRLEERPSYPPRGLIIATGEALPHGESILARTVITRLEKEMVDKGKLKEFQARAGRLPHAMRGFIEWLAPQIEALPPKLTEIFRAARDRAWTVGVHLRTPEGLAHLWVGAVIGLEYATHVEALSADNAAALTGKLWDTLTEVAKGHAEQLQAEQPVRRWLGWLLTLFQQRKVFVLPKGGTPTAPRPGVEFVGWLDGDHVLLLPEAAMQAIGKLARDTNQPFHASRDTILRGLKRERLSLCDGERTLHCLRIGEDLTRVLCLIAPAVGEFLGDAFAPAVTGSLMPLGGQEAFFPADPS